MEKEANIETTEVVRLLLEKGANIEARGGDAAAGERRKY